MTTTPAEVCAVSTRRRRVVVVVAHCAMRALIVELLQRDPGFWTVSALDSVSEIDQTTSSHPDLVIVDTADFATVRRQLPPTFAPALVVVIGPEPDPAYRQAAIHLGAAAWLSRDRIGEELCTALRSALTCAGAKNPAPWAEPPTDPIAPEGSDD